MAKAKTLEPIPQTSVPFWVGEKVAFREDHADHPGMYGLIETIGVADGLIQFDVSVIDPSTGGPVDPPVTRRATMEDIQ